MSAPPTPSSPFGSPSTTLPFHSHPSLLSNARLMEPPPQPNRNSHVQFKEPLPASLAQPPLVRSLSTGYDAGHERNVLPSPQPTRPKSMGLAGTSHWRVGKSSTQLSNHGRSPRPRSSSRRRRSSLIITPPSPPPRDQWETPSGSASHLIRTVPKFRQAVLELLATIATQDESPLNRSEPVIMEVDHLMASTQKEPDMIINLKRSGDVGKQSEVSSEMNRSSSEVWQQQKCLLDVELQRLFTWETNLREHANNTRSLTDLNKSGTGLFTDQNIKTLKDAFSSIGISLITALKEGYSFREKVERVETIFKEVNKVHLLPDPTTQQREDPLESIKCAVTTLFGLLKLMEQSTKDSGGHMDPKQGRSRSSRQLSASSQKGAFVKIRDTPKTTRRSRSPKGTMTGVRKEPQLRRVARTIFHNTENDALRKDKEIDMNRTSITPMENPSKARDSADVASSSRDFQKKIVLKFADHPDAFVERRKGPFSTISSSLERDIGRKVSQLDTNELDPSMLELSGHFSTLGMRLPSALIVDKLRELSQYEDSNDVAGPPDSVSPTSILLDSVNSILALFKSMPDWYIYTRTDQKTSAAAAVSFIRYSLLEQVTTCIAEISFQLESRLARSSDPGRVRSQFGALCDLIPMVDQLPELIRDSRRDRDLQLYLRLIETRLMIAIADIEHAEKLEAEFIDSDVDLIADEAVVENDFMLETRSPSTPISRAFGGAKTKFPSEMNLLSDGEPSERYEDIPAGPRPGLRKYPLLALACYLETADEKSTDTKEDPRYIPSGLDLLTVKDVLYTSDVNMSDGV